MALLREKSNEAYLYWAEQVVRRTKGQDPAGAPSFLYLEPSSGCNLKCPACVTGTTPSARTRKQASRDDHEAILDALGDTLLRVDFYNWGEPFLNKSLPQVVRMASDRSIYSSLSTNFSFPRLETRIEDVLDAGLSSLKVGLDGASQEVHARYRRGADLDTVKANLAHAARHRDKAGLSTRIYASFLVFDHNVHELQEVFDFCDSIDVELEINQSPFTSRSAGIVEAPGVSRDIRHDWAHALASSRLPEKRCSWLYHTAVINPNMTVSPCCAVADERDDFVTLNRDSLRDEARTLLAKPAWRDARRFLEDQPEDAFRQILLTGSQLDEESPGMGNTKGDDFICARCPMGAEVFKYVHIAQRMLNDLLAEAAHHPIRTPADQASLSFKTLVCTYLVCYAHPAVGPSRVAELEAALPLLRAILQGGPAQPQVARSLSALVGASGLDPLRKQLAYLLAPAGSLKTYSTGNPRHMPAGVGPRVARIMQQHQAAQALDAAPVAS